MNSHDSSGDPRIRNYVTTLLAVVIFLLSLWGFGTKFIELVRLSRSNVEGAFAITPVVNYLLASLGFLCLFGWAAAHGMFHDIERPKQTMLENEARLDSLPTPTDGHSAARRESP